MMPLLSARVALCEAAYAFDASRAVQAPGTVNLNGAPTTNGLRVRLLR